MAGGPKADPKRSGVVVVWLSAVKAGQLPIRGYRVVFLFDQHLVFLGFLVVFLVYLVFVLPASRLLDEHNGSEQPALQVAYSTIRETSTNIERYRGMKEAKNLLRDLTARHFAGFFNVS